MANDLNTPEESGPFVLMKVGSRFLDRWIVRNKMLEAERGHSLPEGGGKVKHKRTFTLDSQLQVLEKGWGSLDFHNGFGGLQSFQLYGPEMLSI